MKKIFLLIILIIIILFLILIKNKNTIENFNNEKIVIHKIQLQPKLTEAFPPGFGDILKGTVSLYMISKKHGYNFYLDLTEHPIGKYINKTIPDNYLNLSNEINEYFINFNIFNHNDLITEVNTKMNTNDIGFFETNLEPELNKELTLEDKKQIQELIKPNEYLQNKIDNIKNELNLNNYSVLHIRTGDENINKGLNSKIINSVEEKLNNIKLPENILLLSDSKELKEYLNNKYKFKIINSDIIHLGYLNSENKEKGIESTLIDFFVICGADKIYSLSVYDWNSGFSTMASRIYDIPIEKYKI
jgi:hypothetical protein